MFHFNGDLDEITCLQPSAFGLGNPGRFTRRAARASSTPTLRAHPLGLAEAQVKLNGALQPVFFGNNTNWQTTNITFTATQTNTPLQIAGWSRACCWMRSP